MNPPASITTADSTDSSTASQDMENETPPESSHEMRVSFKDDLIDNEDDFKRGESCDSFRSGYSEEIMEDAKPVAKPANTFKYKPVKATPVTEEQVVPPQDYAAAAEPFKEEPTSMRQRKSAFQQKALGQISKMYDLENKGYLTAEEQLMREMDVENKGYLTKEQVYEIVRQKLEEEHDVKQYKMAAVWMMGFMVLLTLCGFGTSYTSAILSKELSADVDSGAVLVKNTDTVIGVDGIGDTLNFSELSDVEYSERRERVLQEMQDQDMMELHHHRRLANKRHGYTIIFDQGKVPERDLESIIERCEKGNVVNIQRTWKNRDGSVDRDFDTICGPEFTVMNKNGVKNKSRNKSKVRMTREQVVFRKGPRKNAGDDGDTVSFVCEKGWW